MNQYRWLLSLGFCFVLYTAVQIDAQPPYEVVDLGDFFPQGLNDEGLVVGSIDGRAATWWQGVVDDQIVPGALPGTVAVAVNNSEHIVGDDYRRFITIWTSPPFQSLWFAGPGDVQSVRAISPGSLIGSWYVEAAAQYHAYVFVPRGNGWARVSLDGLPGGAGWYKPSARLFGFCGDYGAVGSAQTPEDEQRAVLWVWPDTQPRDLGTLGGRNSVMLGCNPYTVAVGWSTTADGRTLGYQWNPWVGQVVHHPLPGFESSMLLDVNTREDLDLAVDIVGVSTRGQESRATHWTWDAKPTDLNTVMMNGAGWVLQRAVKVNERGQIIGTGTLNGQPRGFLLTPVPAAPPSLAIHLNQSDFAPGQTLRMALEMHNPGPLLTTDVYVGVILPDGEQVVFLTNLSPLEGQLTTLSSNPRTFARLLQGVSWPANLHATQEHYWVYTRSGLEANGTYHLIVAWTKPNSLQDGSIDEGDILALDWKAFRFTGPASTLAAKAQEIRARHATK